MFRCLIIAACFLTCGAVAAQKPDETAFFEQRIRPLLAKHCYKCHGAKKQENDLRLDSRAALLAGGESGEAVITGNPAKSPLLEYLRHEGDIKMPPKKKLPQSDIDAVARWIKMGLPWPNDPETKSAESNEQLLLRARKEHWSFQPIDNPEPPKIKRQDWPAQPIDRFVLAKLEASGLTPSPRADRRTLIRRATYDLWGLPPTPEQVDAFLADKSADAYAKLINRLLASPHYGERWGRHWLDVARYADTKGYAFTRERRYPYAYTYRDYVIRAMNDDLPLDQFIVEQLAADLLPKQRDPMALAALGFLTVGRRFNNRLDDIDDQIDVVGRGLLGLTVACARCHDHKYDPIPSEDYYSIYGVFANTREPKTLPLLGDPAKTPGYDVFKRELDKRQKVLGDFCDKKHQVLQHNARARVTDYLVRVATKKPEKLLKKLPFISLSANEVRPRVVEAWRRHLTARAKDTDPIFGPWGSLAKIAEARFSADSPEVIERWTSTLTGTKPRQINPLVHAALIKTPPKSKLDLARLYGSLLQTVHAKWQKLGGRKEDADDEAFTPAERQLLTVVVRDNSPTLVPRDRLQNYLDRADRNKYRELEKKVDEHQVRSAGAPPRAMVVEDLPKPVDSHVLIRGTPGRKGKQVPRQFLAALSDSSRKPFGDGSGRLALARAIVAPNNPLTARVLVNRVWQHHFGRPLVATPSDFGLRSDEPTHPDLMDHLARELIDGKWSLKSLHRQIMLSATYCQSSVNRPDCRIKDQENRLLWRMNRRRLEFEAIRDSLLFVAGRLDVTPGGKPYQITKRAANRRTIYAEVDRQDLPGIFRTFDFASPDQSAAGRPQTTVPQQALYMMNAPLVVGQAKALVARTEVTGKTHPKDRLAALYRIVYQRTPDEHELSSGVAFVASAQANAKLNGWQQYAQLLLMSNEFMFVD